MGAGAALGPMVLPALGLTAAGALYNTNIQNKAVSEQNQQNQMAMAMAEEARIQETMRQRAMEADQFAAVDTAAAASDPGALRKEVEEFADQPNDFTAAAETYNLPTLTGQQTSGEVSETIGKTISEALERTKGMLQAQATLSRQGTGFSGMEDEAMGMRDSVSNVGSNRRRSSGVAQMETNISPAKVTPSDSILGDIMLATGSLMAGGAFGGAAGGAGAAAAGQPLNAIPWLGPLNPAPSPFGVGFG